ncbi:MAG: M48 family metalloprotease [Thermoanaerobaculia bacterium]
MSGGTPRSNARGAGFSRGRLLLALAIAAISIIGYCNGQVENPVTGERQYVDLSPEQEIALGVQAAPEMAAQHGGLYPDERVQQLADRVGGEIVSRTRVRETPYQFDFHVLADEQVVNAFALPGGQVFITAALMNRMNSIGQLAGVLGHEIGHVVARHGAEHLAKAKLTQGLTGAAVLATYDPSNPSSRGSAAVAALIGQVVNLKFGREDELESDRLGVHLMAQAGYDPQSMLDVMRILAEAAQGPRPPEFFSTHPNPENRLDYIERAIHAEFPDGVPEGLTR